MVALPLGEHGEGPVLDEDTLGCSGRPRRIDAVREVVGQHRDGLQTVATTYAVKVCYNHPIYGDWQTKEA